MAGPLRAGGACLLACQNQTRVRWRFPKPAPCACLRPLPPTSLLGSMSSQKQRQASVNATMLNSLLANKTGGSGWGSRGFSAAAPQDDLQRGQRPGTSLVRPPLHPGRVALNSARKPKTNNVHANAPDSFQYDPRKTCRNNIRGYKHVGFVGHASDTRGMRNGVAAIAGRSGQTHRVSTPAYNPTPNKRIATPAYRSIAPSQYSSSTPLYSAGGNMFGAIQTQTGKSTAGYTPRYIPAAPSDPFADDDPLVPCTPRYRPGNPSLLVQPQQPASIRAGVPRAGLGDTGNSAAAHLLLSPAGASRKGSNTKPKTQKMQKRPKDPRKFNKKHRTSGKRVRFQEEEIILGHKHRLFVSANIASKRNRKERSGWTGTKEGGSRIKSSARLPAARAIESDRPLEYDPMQPQYSPTYDPDPAVSEEEYAMTYNPNYPGYSD